MLLIISLLYTKIGAYYNVSTDVYIDFTNKILILLNIMFRKILFTIIYDMFAHTLIFLYILAHNRTFLAIDANFIARVRKLTKINKNYFTVLQY